MLKHLAQEFLPFYDLMRDLSYQKDATPEVVGRLETIAIDPKKLSSGQNATPPQLTKDNDSSKPKRANTNRELLSPRLPREQHERPPSLIASQPR